MNCRVAALALACVLSATGLSACKSSATFTQSIGGAKAELTDLNGTAEGDFDLPYFDGQIAIELESGTIDVEVIDTSRISTGDDDEDIIEFGSIYEGEGLASGDVITFSDNDGSIRLRITSSDGATGTLTLSEQG